MTWLRASLSNCFWSSRSLASLPPPKSLETTLVAPSRLSHTHEYTRLHPDPPHTHRHLLLLSFHQPSAPARTSSRLLVRGIHGHTEQQEPVCRRTSSVCFPCSAPFFFFATSPSDLSPLLASERALHARSPSIDITPSRPHRIGTSLHLCQLIQHG